MSIQVLLIEDDQPIAHTIADALAGAGFAVEHARTMAEGRASLERRDFDLLILDLVLPDGNGLELADGLRRSGCGVPILMLTGRDTVDARVTGFEHGADDYLGKPFAVEELVARLRSLHRRAHMAGSHVLRFADVELDLLNRHVRRGDIEATLSARETDLLAYLMLHPDDPLPRERIRQIVWGSDAEDESNVLNVYVNYLRNKLEAGRYPRLIFTVRGVGYILSQTDPEQVG